MNEPGSVPEFLVAIEAQLKEVVRAQARVNTETAQLADAVHQLAQHVQSVRSAMLMLSKRVDRIEERRR